jgi:hypothetical protein
MMSAVLGAFLINTFKAAESTGFATTFSIGFKTVNPGVIQRST